MCGLLWLSGVPFAGSLASALVYVTKRHVSPYVAAQAREAQNFQNTISILVALVIAAYAALFARNTLSVFAGGETQMPNDAAVFALWVIAFMALALAGIMLVNVVASIVAAVAVWNGRAYRYPVNLRFLR